MKLKNKKTANYLMLLSATLLVCTACGSSSSDSGEPYVPPVDSGDYIELSNTQLISDGPEGEATYDLIESVLGTGSIEAPDLYEENHPEVPHITEHTDEEVGNHFRFILHRDEDIDRDKVENDDRQRNEIKVYGNSDDSLKGFKDTTFEYSWKFRVGDELRITSNFTHLFQLKAVSDTDAPISQPLITITANTKSGNEGLEIRHVDSVGADEDNNDTTTMLLHTSNIGVNWSTQIQGQWLEVFVRANFSENGSLYLSVTPLGEEEPLFAVEENNIKLWRAGDDSGTGNFVRPKWGIYRSLKDLDGLNASEDEVRFADFSISEVQLVE